MKNISLLKNQERYQVYWIENTKGEFTELAYKLMRGKKEERN